MLSPTLTNLLFKAVSTGNVEFRMRLDRAAGAGAQTPFWSHSTSYSVLAQRSDQGNDKNKEKTIMVLLLPNCKNTWKLTFN